MRNGNVSENAGNDKPIDLLATATQIVSDHDAEMFGAAIESLSAQRGKDFAIRHTLEIMLSVRCRIPLAELHSQVDALMERNGH